MNAKGPCPNAKGLIAFPDNQPLLSPHPIKQAASPFTGTSACFFTLNSLNLADRVIIGIRHIESVSVGGDADREFESRRRPGAVS